MQKTKVTFVRAETKDLTTYPPKIKVSPTCDWSPTFWYQGESNIYPAPTFTFGSKSWKLSDEEAVKKRKADFNDFLDNFEDARISDYTKVLLLVQDGKLRAVCPDDGENELWVDFDDGCKAKPYKDLNIAMLSDLKIL